MITGWFRLRHREPKATTVAHASQAMTWSSRASHGGMPLDVAFRAFLLSRRAARCTAKTLEHYQYTVGGFVQWLGELDVATVQEITASHIRTYLVSLQDRGLKDTTQHAHARGIKAWLNWLVREGDLEESPMRNVAMPRLEKRVPAPFTAEDVRALLVASATE